MEELRTAKRKTDLELDRKKTVLMSALKYIEVSAHNGLIAKHAAASVAVKVEEILEDFTDEEL